MFSSRVKRRRASAILGGVLAAALVSSGLTAGAASADTAPVNPGEPETVSASALPTVQINGVVWAQVIVGNRVYATGQFSQARPAGAAAGTNQTARANILAYDITTGNLITSWAPTLNAQGRSLAASPDGSTIYVGGDFTQVSGTARSRIAAINATTGALQSFNPGANNSVMAIAPSGNTVYYGGYFTSTNGGNRSRLAAANATTGAVTGWAPTSNHAVQSMVVHPASGRVIVGGSMNTLNGVTARGMGSLDGQTGAVMPWAANQVIQNYGDNAAIVGLIFDGEKIYGTGWAFFGGGATANFEGVFAADPLTGEIDWINGGRGDNYSLAVTGDVVYVAGHPHDWGMVGFNPQYDPYKFQYGIAINKHRSPTLTNAYGSSSIWLFEGMPAAEPLHWLPTLSQGTYTGQYQAGWSVAANSNYVVMGGEFPRVNGANQQGLVRFAKRSVNPANDPIQGAAELKPVLTAQGPGTVRVAWTEAWDRDNARLTVQVLRGANAATAAVINTFQTESTWFNREPLAFVDSTAPPGSSQTYRVRVTDPWGTTLTSASTAITVPSGTPTASAYRAAVTADNPTNYWRLGEDSGTTAYDRKGSNDLTLSAEAQRNQPGALIGESDASVNYPGTTSTGTVQGVSPYWQQGPDTFSLEAWVNTTTTTGGKIIGFGERNDGRSGSNGVDRHIYMNNAGQFYFGVRPDMGIRQTINSPGSYRDGQWHQVVGTLSSEGMKLYVDGALVASNPLVKKGQFYRGYWRIGGDRTSQWPSAPTREAFSGRIDEAAVYPTALSLSRVQAHYAASGRSDIPNVNPVASFTDTSNGLTANLTSTSTDADGTIVGWDWDFGDGTPHGTTASVSHPYASAGTRLVTLTVTDDDGGTHSTSRNVTVNDPPPNTPPTASFTSTTQFLTASFTSTSSDLEGPIVSATWDFGDGGTASGNTAQRSYAAPGTYNVSLTVMDADGVSTTVVNPVTATAPPAGYATDLFGRTVVNGLGNADLGGAWTVSGAATSYSVSGGVGRIAGAVGANRAAYLASVRQRDVDFTTDVALDRAATGGGAYLSVIGRRVSNGNDYRVKVRYLAGGSVAAYLVRTVGGVETTLASTTVAGLTLSPGDILRVRLQVNGAASTNVRAKVWRASVAEPAGWLLTNTSAAPAALQVAGDLGLLLYTSSSWTGATPVVLTDNLAIGPIPAP